MFKKTLIAAGALIAASAFAVPASASTFSFGYSNGNFFVGSQPQHAQQRPHWNRGHQRQQVLPARSVIRELHRHGYRNVGNLQRRGNVYTARAVNPRGHWVMVQVNAHNGRILRG